MFPPSATLARALVAGTLAFAASASAFAGTVSHGTFTGSQVTYHDVTESGPDIPPGLFVPKAPQVTNLPVSQLNFLPEQFVQTGGTGFELQTKSSLLSIGVAGNADTASGVAYALAGMKFNIAGNYNLYAPFGANDLGAGMPASIAKITQSASYTIQVTGVNWAPYSSGSLFNGSMVITPDAMTVTGPQSGYVNGTWAGSTTIDWNAVRAAVGLGASDYITDVRVQFTADLAAAAVYGSARTSLTAFNVESPTDPVAVPEPPTIILAGLGAVAVVANGYRRKKQRRDTAMTVEQMEETGAIALTA